MVAAVVAVITVEFWISMAVYGTPNATIVDNDASRRSASLGLYTRVLENDPKNVLENDLRIDPEIVLRIRDLENDLRIDLENVLGIDLANVPEI